METVREALAAAVEHNFGMNHRTAVLSIGARPMGIVGLLSDQIAQIRKARQVANAGDALRVAWCCSGNRPSQSNSDLAMSIISYDKASLQLGTTNDILILGDLNTAKANQLAMLIETVRGGGAVLIPFTRREYDSLSLYYRRMISLLKDAIVIDCDLQTVKSTYSPDNTNTASGMIIDESIDGDTIIYESTDGDTAKASENNQILARILKMCNNADQMHIVTSCYKELIKSKESGHSSTAHDGSKAFLTDHNSMISVVSKRGRGKSSAIGLALAALLQANAENIAITSVAAESVQEIFAFCIIGLEQTGCKVLTNDHKTSEDRRGIRRGNSAGSNGKDDAGNSDKGIDNNRKDDSGNSDKGIDNNRKDDSGNNAKHIILVKRNGIIMQLKISHSNQTVSFIAPESISNEKCTVNGKYDLLVVDEAAAIPVNHLKNCLTQMRVVLISTDGGYEGTGKSYSIKILNEAEKKRKIVHLILNDPIRYSENDKMEKWINEALLLGTGSDSDNKGELPGAAIGECGISEKGYGLFAVSKEALFSVTNEGEEMLRRICRILSATHYRFSPDDLRIYADNEEHMMFVCIDTAGNIIGVLEVAQEGGTRKQEGNMIPWIIQSTHGDESLFLERGARIVRISVIPCYEGRGAGSFMVNSLKDPFEFAEIEIPESLKFILLSKKSFLSPIKGLAGEENDGLAVHQPAFRWIGVSFGLKESLLHFWAKNQFLPVCIKQRTSEKTGEHSMVMLWNRAHSGDMRLAIALNSYFDEFLCRFLRLLRFSFKNLEAFLCLAIIHRAKRNAVHNTKGNAVHNTKINSTYSPPETADGDKIDLEEMRLSCGKMTGFISDESSIILSENTIKRVRQFAEDCNSTLLQVIDVFPEIAMAYFTSSKIEKLAVLHQAVLLAIGLQNKLPGEVCSELSLGCSIVERICREAIKEILEFSLAR